MKKRWICLFVTKCYKSQEKFWFLSRILETSKPKCKGDSRLDPVPYGAVALRESGEVIIVPPTPKGGFKFKKGTPIYRNALYNKLILYIIFSLTIIIS